MRIRLLLVVLLGLAVLGACTRTPDEPGFDNPFDPAGTNPGGGYGLRVESRGGDIVMTWDNLPGVTGYSVYWSSDSPDFRGMTRIAETVPIVEGSLLIEFSHQDFLAEKTNWYRIQGRTLVDAFPGDPDPALVDVLESDPVAIDITVLVYPSEGQTSTPTRFIDLFVLTGVAGEVEISNARTFVDARLVPVTPGTPDTVSYSLPDNLDENLTDLWVHFRTRTRSSVGAADSFAIQARFSPQLTIERGLRTGPGGPFMVDTTQIFGFDDLEGAELIEKVQRKRLDGSGSMVVVEDIPPPGLNEPIELDLQGDVTSGVVADGQLVVTLLSDFGFSSEVVIDLRVPESIGEPQIEIVGGSIVTDPKISVLSTAANAGFILLSESPAFADSTSYLWVDSAVVYLLDDTPSVGFLFAAFSNPILQQTRVTSTPVTLVSPPPAPHRR
jgi:hypothetical protein